ncbi:hypothetical protein ACH4PU_32600 [Streptomyces sp. NPDC021100]|uniref:hypothetical protein n=1 Tax=Streptomyces sp. NPDC021100 TaxID=3365114 RepID=UPI0037B0A3E6
MATVVVGFRLGTGTRQATVIVSQSGRLYLAEGLYGQRGRVLRPRVSHGKYPVHTQVAAFRAEHADRLRRGYDKVLIPPACVRLERDEPPLHPHPYGPNAPESDPQLLEEFVAMAPSRPQELEQAIYDFLTTIGLPARRRDIPRPRTATAATPPRPVGYTRILAQGGQITSSPRRPVGYRITPETVRLHVGAAGDVLEHGEVVELWAALDAWLQLNPTPGRPSVNTPGGTPSADDGPT